MHENLSDLDNNFCFIYKLHTQNVGLINFPNTRKTQGIIIRNQSYFQSTVT